MCRYGDAKYKQHYACFECRKAFKRRRLEDVDPGGENRAARCPQCGRLMAEMGLDFAPPRSRDVKGWRVLADLWTLGETFHSCGCSGPGYRPRSPSAYAAFLQAIEREYRENLQRWEDLELAQLDEARAGHRRADVQAARAHRAEAVETWRERLEAARSALAARGIAPLPDRRTSARSGFSRLPPRAGDLLS